MKNEAIALFAECNNISKKQYTKMEKFVSMSRKTRLQSYINNIDKILSLTGEFLLFYLIACKYNCVCNKEPFYYGKNGKPYFKNDKLPKFNISHTRNMVGVIIYDKDIGIDIENITCENIESIKELTSFCFSKKEQEYVSLENEGYRERFYDIWTKKEAFYKMTGEGLSLRKINTNIAKSDDIWNFYYKQYTVAVSGVSQKSLSYDIIDDNSIDKMCLKMDRIYKSYI